MAAGGEARFYTSLSCETRDDFNRMQHARLRSGGLQPGILRPPSPQYSSSVRGAHRPINALNLAFDPLAIAALTDIHGRRMPG